MREILFRGKRKYNGEWVEGFYYLRRARYAGDKTFLCEDPTITTGITESSGAYGERTETIEYRVIPETVGQYTGLTDKNGRKIFEGDVLKYTPRPNCVIIYQVVWQQEWSRFALEQWSTHKYQLYEWAEHDKVKYCCEVIGNIRDNPELLKGGEE